MKKDKSEEMLNIWAMVFGNQTVRELGKEKSEWFKKIYDVLDNNVPGFLEFIFTAELTYGRGNTGEGNTGDGSVCCGYNKLRRRVIAVFLFASLV